MTIPTVLQGRAWVWPDDVNTDIIIPFRFKARTNDPYEMAKYCMYGFDPDFHKKVKQGDLFVAGRNFGGGSSREQAPVAIKYAGVSAVVAESFARIFYRNAVNGGFLLPFEVAEPVWQRVKTGDELEIHVSAGTLRNLTAGEAYTLRPLGDVIGILKAGDVFAYAKQSGLMK